MQYTMYTKYGGIHMIKVKLTNEIVNRILTIEKARFSLNTIELPVLETNRLR